MSHGVHFAVPVLSGHHGPVRCLDWVSSERRLFSGGRDKTVKMHNLCADALTCSAERGCVGAQPIDIGTHTGAVSMHAATPTMLTGGGRPCNAAKLWRVRARDSTDDGNGGDCASVVREYEGHVDAVFAVRAHPDGVSSVLTGGGQDDKTARLFDMETGACLIVLGHRGSVRAVRYVGESPHLVVTGSLDQCVRVWDTRIDNSAAAMSATLHHRAGVHCIAMHGHTLVVGQGTRIYPLNESF